MHQNASGMTDKCYFSIRAWMDAWNEVMITCDCVAFDFILVDAYSFPLALLYEGETTSCQVLTDTLYPS